MAEDRADFFDRVYDVVAQIPSGRVTTYGRIARHLGIGRGARAVGWALKAVARSSDPLALPCHRVVNREGALTGRMHFETPDVMEERLRSEGVAFDEEGRVVLSEHVWEPAGCTRSIGGGRVRLMGSGTRGGRPEGMRPSPASVPTPSPQSSIPFRSGTRAPNNEPIAYLGSMKALFKCVLLGYVI